MSRNWRAALFSASLFLLVGANLPYLPVWMEEERGLSGGQISAIIAAATLIRIFAGPAFAAEAERTGLRRVVGRLSMISFLTYLLLLPETPLVMAVILLMGTYILWGGLSPLAEGLLIASTKTGWPDYGVARALASGGFILGSFGVGILVRAYGAQSALWVMVVAAFIMTLASLMLSDDAPAAGRRDGFVAILREGFGLYRNRRIIYLALAASLIQSAHAYYYNLGSNIWIGQGIEASQVGALWSVGVIAEVCLLIGSGVLLTRHRWTPGGLVLLGGAGAVLRWTIAGFAPGLVMLYGIQTLHALSFAATHIGSLRFLEEEIAPEKIPVIMSINSALVFGPMLAVFGVLAGQYYDYVAITGVGTQAGGYWLMAGVAGMGCVFALPILKRVRPKVPAAAD